MKEHFQDYGVRKWAGDDLIELQSEPLAALQALVEPYAPCIIQGCEVTENGNGGITVSPGLVALKGKDSKGNACVKIARFAGIESETSIYLTLACEAVNRLYGDGNVKDIAYDYKAVASTQRPDEPFLEISGKEVPRLVDTLGITKKLDREGGDASDVKVVSFREDSATDRINITAGMTLKELFGKIYRWLKDLGTLAFKNTVARSDFDPDLGAAFDSMGGKLSSIDDNANNYTHPTTSGNKHIPDGGSTGQYLKYSSDGTAAWATPDSDLASTSSAGFMSSADKTKLEGIAARAQVNVQADWNEANSSNDAFIKNKPTASNIGGKLPIANGGTGETTASAAAGALLNGLGPGNAIPTDNANIVISGNGTTTYYKKPLSLLWNWIKSKLATVATSGSYNDLANKPTIPTVNNGTITIKQAGTTKGTFTVNQSGSTTIELTDNNTVYSHPNTLSAQTGAGPSSDSTLSVGSVFKVPALTANTNGHIIDLRTRNLTLPGNATTSSAGFMSAADKQKLDTMRNPIPVGVYFLGADGLRHEHGESIQVTLNKTTKMYTIKVTNGIGAYTFLPLSYNGNTIVFNNDYIDSRNNYQIDCYIRTLDSSSKSLTNTGFVMFRLF